MNIYPDLSWTQFLQCCTASPRDQFEEMMRRIFIAEYLHGQEILYSETSHPGIEVDPVLEPAHEDGTKRKLISFQSKYFDTSVGYDQIKDSAETAAKYYKGKLDRIYLFCNLTINRSRSSTYRNTEKYLADAGIELIPVCNAAILDLVFRHKEIADYYFLPRNRTYSIGGVVSTTFITGEINSATVEVDALPDANSELYHRLLKEKIAQCKKLLLDLNLTQMKAELDSLKDVKEEGVLFYRFLLFVHEGKMEEATNCKRKLNGDYRNDAEWLFAFIKKPHDIGFYELQGHSLEVQIILLNELLNKNSLENLLRIYDESRNEKLDENLRKALSFNYAIALFNSHRLEEAREELRILEKTYHVPAYRFFYLCADLHIKNMEYGFGTKEKASELQLCLEKLKETADQVAYLYRNNEKLVAMLEIQAYYNLSSIDGTYLEKANNAFLTFADAAKRDSHVLYFLGMCYEVANDIDGALEIYTRPECSQDDVVLYRRGACLLKLNRYEEAYNCVKDNESDNPGIVGIRLAAEYRLGDQGYKKDLKAAIERYKDSLENLFPIAYHTENTEIFNECVQSSLADRLDVELNSFDEGKRIALLLIFIKHRELSAILKIIRSGINLRCVDGYIIHQLYDALIDITNAENRKGSHSLIPSDNLKYTEQIADAFINSDAYPDRFLHVRLGCLSSQERHFAMLQDSKRLYELTGDLGVARNIVALLYSQNEKRAEEYEPYLSALSHSDVPAHAIAVCSGAMRLGNSEMAERYAYKALYLLNGEDDYEIYRNYFSYVSSFVLRRPEGKSYNKVSENMVVELHDNFSNSVRIVCLDSEAEFSNEGNNSLGVEHLKQGDTNYTKIIRAGIGQVVKVFGSHYKITSFMPRADYAFRFVSAKIHEHPEKFEGVVWLDSAENPQKMIEEIKKHTDRTEQTKHVLGCYHFEETESGIPIDMLCYGDYSRYIDSIRMLLYGPDQALYAGIAEIENELKGPYVPTLSTLVLLSQLNQLKLLGALRDTTGISVIIPDSYIDFFEEQFSNSTSTLDVSPGILTCGKDGKLLMIENDRHIPEMWEEILEWCKQCEKETISTEERASFSFTEDITGEHLVSVMRMNKIQLDALILAKKRQATYISEDLFMRKAASWTKVKNNNFTFLLYFLNDINYASEITMELSRTNYVYTPIFTVDPDKRQELIQNLLTGERKQQLYGAMLERVRQAFLRALGIEPEKDKSE